MFERFTDPWKVVYIVQTGNFNKLTRLVRSGCRMDRRTTYDPWMTPLDAAASTGNVKCARILLDSGVPIWGSSIFDAIQEDAASILELFREFDQRFYNNFLKDKPNSVNPRLNRWLIHFSALDYSLSISARRCSEYLTSLGAPKAQRSRYCSKSHFAPYVSDNTFIVSGGINIDGLSEIVEGYNCAKCERFV